MEEYQLRDARPANSCHEHVANRSCDDIDAERAQLRQWLTERPIPPNPFSQSLKDRERYAEATTYVRRSRFRTRLLRELRPYAITERPEEWQDVYLMMHLLREALRPEEQARVVRRWVDDSGRNPVFMVWLFNRCRDQVDHCPYGFVRKSVAEIADFGGRSGVAGRAARDLVSGVANQWVFSQEYRDARAQDRLEDEERDRPWRERAEEFERAQSARRQRIEIMDALSTFERMTLIADGEDGLEGGLPDHWASLSVQQLSTLPAPLRARLGGNLVSHPSGPWRQLARVLSQGKVEAAEERNLFAQQLDGLTAIEKLGRICSSSEPFWMFPVSIAEEALRTVQSINAELRAELLARLPEGKGAWAELRRELKRSVANDRTS